MDPKPDFRTNDATGPTGPPVKVVRRAVDSEGDTRRSGEGSGAAWGDMRRTWTGVAALAVCAGLSPAQTTNELRDPRGSVFRAFPEADSFRAIVRDVDRAARSEVERRLPFKVHFNELGPHALYVAFRERKPLGLMYLRREEGRWGITEVAWALTLDLRIVGFDMLRGRSQYGHALARSAFARRLVGLGYEDVAALQGADGALALEDGVVFEGGEHLARTVLRSAMKTLLVTDAVWRGELSKLQDLAMGLDAFPAAERFRRQLRVLGDEEETLRQLQSVRVMRAIGAAHSELGAVVRTEARDGDRVVTLRWVLTPGLRVARIVPDRIGADPALRASCNRFEGLLLAEGPDDASLVAFVARQLVPALQEMRDLGRR